jgi:hypothetical protein
MAKGDVFMLDKRLAATVAAMALSGGVAVVAALLPQQEEVVPLNETVGDVPMSHSAPAQEPPQPPESRETGWLYLIKEHDGKIAVFKEGLQIPVMVLDKWVRHLPDYDRIQMAAGIEIFSEEELAARIEDYTS